MLDVSKQKMLSIYDAQESSKEVSKGSAKPKYEKLIN